MRAHQTRVTNFMRSAKQATPGRPKIPNYEVRLLRAKLILEEALETIEALGCDVVLSHMTQKFEVRLDPRKEEVIYENTTATLAMIADGCADISVVNIGTMVACGISFQPIVEIVDHNNMQKFGVGHSWDEFGKLVKPPGHKSPEPLIKEEIERQINVGRT